jgi:hypothetical protein
MQNEMNITSAQYTQNLEGEVSSIKATIAGITMSVPLDPANWHLRRLVDEDHLGLDPVFAG